MQHNNKFIIGSSHVVRWRTQKNEGLLNTPIPTKNFIGIPGCPIWNLRLFNLASNAVCDLDQLFILVGDFRFGNSINLHRSDKSDVMSDGHYGVVSQALTNDFDADQFRRSINGLKFWGVNFGSRARYIFWCLFCRQVEDRLEGKYIESGSYRHPHFNFSEIVANIPELDVIDLTSLYSRPMHELHRLYIDKSGHPSYIGYLFLENLIFSNMDVNAAYDNAVNIVESILFDLASSIVNKCGSPVLFTGRSVWLDTLVRYLGATGVERMHDIGLFIAPLNNSRGQKSAKDIALRKYGNNLPVFIFTSLQFNLERELLDILSINPNSIFSATVIDWESTVVDIIKSRGEQEDFQHKEKIDKFELDRFHDFSNDASHVELGKRGEPTWTGLTSVMQSIINLK